MDLSLRRVLVACGLLPLLFLLGPATAGQAAPAKWLELRTTNFLLEGDVGERDLRDVGRRLEEFREALARLFPKARLATTAPTVVLVFGSDKAYDAFRPLYEGKPMKVAGYFMPGRDVNYVTMVLNAGNPYPIIFHEFTHLMVRATIGDTPLWFNEGLAEFYSSFAVSSDGKQAYIGKVVDRHILALRDRFLPLAEILATDHASPLYNDTNRRSTFYAESWAFLHYLLNGRPERRPQTFTFLGLLAARKPFAQACQEAFGVPTASLESEVRDYVHKLAFRYDGFRFDQPIAARVAGVAQPLAQATVEARLGDLLVHMNRQADGERRLQAALELDESDVQAHLSLGELCLRQNKQEEGLAHLRAAVAAHPDNFAAQRALGEALVRRVAPAGPEQLAAGRAAFEQALKIEPDSVDAGAALAWVYLLSHDRLEDAQRLAERAAERSPLEPDHVLLLAQVLAERKDFAAARQRLGPLLAHERADVRDRARRVMGLIVEYESRVNAMARAAAESPTLERLPVGPPSGTSTSTRGAVLLDLRRVRDGEQRAFGLLERIECTPRVTIFHVKSGDRAMRLTAVRFDAVEFISFRTDLKGNVECGPRQPSDPVYVTYRAAAPGESQAPVAKAARPAASTLAPDGEVVAVEFVPKDYVPKK